MFRSSLVAIAVLIGAVLIHTGCEFEQIADDEEAEPGLEIQLPTSNDALLNGDPAAFYQGLDMTIPGLRPEPWMGGRYGFVRNQAVTPVGRVFTRIHQGIDIRPLYRDAAGAPLDTVRVIDDGRVAFVNASPGASAYGIYVVVEHEWEGTPVFSFYAHLASVAVDSSQVLAAGEPIGRMGYTGAGLHRDRAHLHLEITLKMNSHYDDWHDRFYGTPNLQGAFFGRNFMGIDPAALYLALEDDPSLTFTDFLQSLPVGYRIALPGDRPIEVLERYPWLAADGVTPADSRTTGSWVVSFTREGVPVEIGRQDEHVPRPRVVYVSEEIRRGYLSTGGVVIRTEGGFSLGRQGRGFVALLATTEGDVPPWF